MITKLTLSVDPEIVSSAKRYAADHGVSVSRLVEAFLSTLTREATEAPTPPVLARMRGSMSQADQDQYHQYLAEKYR